MLIWIVGQGGLLGSAIARGAAEIPDFTIFTADPISWGSEKVVQEEFESMAARFALQAGDDPWAIIWAAGHATVSSSEAETAVELEALTSLCQSIRRNPPPGRGSFFLSSSAGGVYGGSLNPPFSIATEPAPLSPYGRLKISQEAAATRELSDICPVNIGRISNLYGPGQDLAKLQGLISALARAAVTRKPINMFVSLDTIRDYIYADDAARQILQISVDSSFSNVSNTGCTYILASGQPVSLGYLINLVQDIARVKVPIALGAHASAAAQSRDLRLTPTQGAWRDQNPSTPISAGVKSVFLDVLERAQRGDGRL